MSRIRKCLTVAAGAAAGLFLSALASNATAAADPVTTSPGLPGLVDQVLTSSASIPQQLLQGTTSTSVLPGAGPLDSVLPFLGGPALTGPVAAAPGMLMPGGLLGPAATVPLVPAATAPAPSTAVVLVPGLP